MLNQNSQKSVRYFFVKSPHFYEIFRRFIVASFIVIAFLLLALTSCSNAEEVDAAIEVTDLSGRTVTLDAPATRIAALSASDCEVLYALGAGNTIVARGTFCDYPEEVKSVKDLGSGELTNIEELVALKPDIVLMSKTGFTLDQVSAMESAGLKTFVNQADTFDDTYKYIKLLGEITGHNEEATKLVADMTLKVSEYFKKTKTQDGQPTKSVYFQLCMPQHGSWTAGKNTFMDEMAGILNLKNIFDDVEGWVEVSSEQIAVRKPDVTVVIDNDESFLRPGPRLIDALNKLYQIAYEN